MRWLALAVFLALGCATPARVEWTVRPSAGDAAILDGLEARVRDTLTSMHHPVEKVPWEKATARIRRELRRSLGLDLLPPAVPKNVRSVGMISRGDYRIEKLVYETLPRVEVPAHQQGRRRQDESQKTGRSDRHRRPPDRERG